MVSRLQAAQGCRKANGLFLEHWVPFSWTPGSPQVVAWSPMANRHPLGTSTADSAAAGADEPVRPAKPVQEIPAVGICSEPRDQLGVGLWFPMIEVSATRCRS